MKARQPHFTEGEKAVLSACILENGKIPDVCDSISVQDFYHERHRHIFRAIEGLSKTDSPVDLVTLGHALTSSGTLEASGGHPYLVELLDAVPSAANWRHYAEQVRKHTQLRELITSATEIVTACYTHDADPSDIQERFQQAAFTAGSTTSSKNPASLREILPSVLDEFTEGAKQGIPSGLPTLDYYTNGFRPDELVFIGGRPSMGKSALGHKFAASAAKETTVVLFSLEMSEVKVAARLLASKARVNLKRLLSGKGTDSDWNQIWPAVETLQEYPIFIDDSPHISVAQIKSRVRQVSLKHGFHVGLVIVDYLQLMKAATKTDDEVKRVGEITRDLKILSKELSCCVVCLSQLNRQLEYRPFQNHGRMPKTSDFRASGRIEEDADIIVGLYRPEVYANDIPDADKEKLKGQAIAAVLKQRNGPTGLATLMWDAPTCTFRSPVPDGVTDPNMETM